MPGRLIIPEAPPYNSIKAQREEGIAQCPRSAAAVLLRACPPPPMCYALPLLLVLATCVHGAALEPTSPWLSHIRSSVPPSPSPPPGVVPQGASGRQGEALAAALIQLLQKAATAPACPHPYTQVVHECFYHHMKKLTWLQGRRVCQGMGGDLAEPRHIYALQTTWPASTVCPGYFWVGGTSEGGDGTWRWMSGRPLDPKDWLFSRPDNQGGDENCLELVISDYPKVFNDETCSLAQRFICQYRQE
ncbi:Macrophage mannose receptor 1 [Chionoecetes opilio]|uniref:Macrophage mannose receptor 1 n=1 Tax=Chionoecetes opilio TaxID=41210 RepID=A0A8J5CQU1_CHIOP|nr:Macrophage mannose receptor 1 [Chionoecetes opilio]